MKKELDINTFGELVDGFLEKAEIHLLITLPEGTREAVVEDNVKAGSTIQFYILMHAMSAVFQTMFEEMSLDPEKREEVLDGIFDMMKREILKEDE